MLTEVRQRSFAVVASISVQWAVMSASQMRVEDRLVGASNWSPWKAKNVFVFEDFELWDIVQVVVLVLLATAPVLLTEFKKRNNNICDAMRNHIIPHLTGKAYAFEMWASLCNLTRALTKTGRWLCMIDSGASACSRMSRLLHTLVDTPISETSLESLER
jgi:hypothetical protein